MVAVSTQHIAVWNILSLTLIWSVPLKIATLTADPKSTYMAVFTTDNSRKYIICFKRYPNFYFCIASNLLILVFVFTPHKSTPVYTRKDFIENNSFILGATFVPHLQVKRDSSYRSWQRRSQLFFLDSNQVCTRQMYAKRIDIKYLYIY